MNIMFTKALLLYRSAFKHLITENKGIIVKIIHILDKKCKKMYNESEFWGSK